MQVPLGSEEAAVQLRESGRQPEFSFIPHDHLQLGEDLDLLDFEAGAEVSGRKFVYLKKAAALLEMALCNYAMQKAAAKGFEPMITPDLVRESVLRKCGFQPRAENTQVQAICWQPSTAVLTVLPCRMPENIRQCSAKSFSDVWLCCFKADLTASFVFGSPMEQRAALR